MGRGAVRLKEKSRRFPKAKKTQQLAYSLRIKEAMNKKVLTLTTGHTMMDVRKVLRDHRISGVPIVESGRLLGIVSIEDLINCLRSGAMERAVEDAMTTEVVTLFADEPLIQAITMFGKHGFGRFPILDRTTGKVVGIITKKDIIQCLLKSLQSLYHAKESRKKSSLEAGRLLCDLPSDGTALTLTYAVKGGDFRKAGEKSDQLKESLLKLGYSDDEIRRLIIAVLEAEMNLVIFTPRGEITVRVEPCRISVRVSDDGPGIADIELAMRPGYSTAPDFVRELGFGAGMGLPNIKKSTDEMRMESSPGMGTNLEFAVVL
jgi:CBS domain-containing protein/anti-sigma regulatory factor (Ser/Thr protein kinase)